MDRNQADDFVRSALRSLASTAPGSTGRGVVGSALKAHVLLLAPSFNEREWGFGSFTAYLRTIPGIVVERGPFDNVARLTDLPASVTGGGVETSRRRHRLVIRRDIWTAFTDLSRSGGYAYDRATGMAFGLAPSAAKPAGDVAPGSGETVPMPTLGAGEQHETCLAFVRTLPDPGLQQTLLAKAETSPLTLASLYNYLLQTPAELGRWRQYRLEVVAERVQTWAASHQIDSTPFFHSARLASLAPRQMTSPALEQLPDIDRLRNLVRDAVAYLSDDQVVAFQFPARFVLSLVDRYEVPRRSGAGLKKR